MGTLSGVGTATQRGIARRLNAYEPNYLTVPVTVAASSNSDYSFGSQALVFTSIGEDIIIFGVQEISPANSAYMSWQLWTGQKLAVQNMIKVVYDTAGNQYMLQQASNGNAVNGITKMTPDRVVTLVAGTAGSSIPVAAVDGSGSAVRFISPISMCMGLDGNLYVTDNGSYHIRKVTTAGTASIFVGSGNSAVTNGTGTGASVSSSVAGINTHPTTGDLYFGDQNNVRKVTVPGGVVTTFGTTASGSNVVDVVWDSTGTYLYAVTFDGVIYRFTAAGAGTLIAGQAGVNSASNSTTGTGAAFFYPYSIAIDATNTALYVRDRGNAGTGGSIRRIGLSGNFPVTTTLGGGTGGNAEGTGNVLSATGTSTNYGQFSTDPQGNLYLVDGGTGTGAGFRVKKIDVGAPRALTVVGIDGSGSGNTFPFIAEYRIAQTSRTWSTSVGQSLWNPLPYPVRLVAGSRLTISANNNTNATSNTTVAVVYAPASSFL